MPDMKTVTHHAPTARSKLLHVETDGAVVNIHVGLTDRDGNAVTAVQILPDGEERGGDGEGRIWHLDGSRLVRQPLPYEALTRLAAAINRRDDHSLTARVLGRLGRLEIVNVAGDVLTEVRFERRSFFWTLGEHERGMNWTPIEYSSDYARVILTDIGALEPAAPLRDSKGGAP